MVIASNQAESPKFPGINTAHPENSKAAIRKQEELWGTQRLRDAQRDSAASPIALNVYHTLKLGRLHPARCADRLSPMQSGIAHPLRSIYRTASDTKVLIDTFVQ
jgi:hypothetical protein